MRDGVVVVCTLLALFCICIGAQSVTFNSNNVELVCSDYYVACSRYSITITGSGFVVGNQYTFQDSFVTFNAQNGLLGSGWCSRESSEKLTCTVVGSINPGPLQIYHYDYVNQVRLAQTVIGYVKPLVINTTAAVWDPLVEAYSVWIQGQGLGRNTVLKAIDSANIPVTGRCVVSAGYATNSAGNRATCYITNGHAGLLSNVSILVNGTTESEADPSITIGSLTPVILESTQLIACPRSNPNCAPFSFLLEGSALAPNPTFTFYAGENQDVVTDNVGCSLTSSTPTYHFTCTSSLASVAVGAVLSVSATVSGITSSIVSIGKKPELIVEESTHQLGPISFGYAVTVRGQDFGNRLADVSASLTQADQSTLQCSSAGNYTIAKENISVWYNESVVTELTLPTWKVNIYNRRENVALTLPFDFRFADTDFYAGDTVWLYSRGFLLMDTTLVPPSITGLQELPIANFTKVIAAWNDVYDLSIDCYRDTIWSPAANRLNGPAKLWVGVTGSFPNRKLVITWNNILPLYYLSPSAQDIRNCQQYGPRTFQMVLEETTNAVVFNYKAVNFNTNRMAKPFAVQYGDKSFTSYADWAKIKSGESLRFFPGNMYTFSNNEIVCSLPTDQGVAGPIKAAVTTFYDVSDTPVQVATLTTIPIFKSTSLLRAEIPYGVATSVSFTIIGLNFGASQADLSVQLHHSNMTDESMSYTCTWLSSTQIYCVLPPNIPSGSFSAEIVVNGVATVPTIVNLGIFMGPILYSAEWTCDSESCWNSVVNIVGMGLAPAPIFTFTDFDYSNVRTTVPSTCVKVSDFNYTCTILRDMYKAFNYSVATANGYSTVTRPVPGDVTPIITSSSFLNTSNLIYGSFNPDYVITVHGRHFGPHTVWRVVDLSTTFQKPTTEDPQYPSATGTYNSSVIQVTAPYKPRLYFAGLQTSTSTDVRTEPFHNWTLGVMGPIIKRRTAPVDQLVNISCYRGADGLGCTEGFKVAVEGYTMDSPIGLILYSKDENGNYVLLTNKTQCYDRIFYGYECSTYAGLGGIRLADGALIYGAATFDSRNDQSSVYPQHFTFTSQITLLGAIKLTDTAQTLTTSSTTAGTTTGAQTTTGSESTTGAQTTTGTQQTTNSAQTSTTGNANPGASTTTTGNGSGSPTNSPTNPPTGGPTNAPTPAVSTPTPTQSPTTTSTNSPTNPQTTSTTAPTQTQPSTTVSPTNAPTNPPTVTKVVVTVKVQGDRSLFNITAAAEASAQQYGVNIADVEVRLVDAKRAVTTFGVETTIVVKDITNSILTNQTAMIERTKLAMSDPTSPIAKMFAASNATVDPTSVSASVRQEVITATTANTPSNTNDDDESGEPTNVVGIAVGVAVAGVVLIAVAVVIVIRRQKKKGIRIHA